MEVFENGRSMSDKPILPLSLLFRQIGRLWSTERGNFVYLFIYLPLNFNLYFACELFKFSAFSRVQRENLFFQKKKNRKSGYGSHPA